MEPFDLGLVLAGGALLVVGATLLVQGASAIALRLGVPPVVTGLTIVAFATSSPELAVSLAAAVTGRVELAAANIVGSNILNVLVILGLAGLVAPLAVATRLVRLDVPLMVGLSIGVVAVGVLAGSIGRLAGLALLGVMATYVVLEVRGAMRADRPPPVDEIVVEGRPVTAASLTGRPWPVDVGLIVGGLIGLVVGAAWLVDGATRIALGLGIPETVVGLTIVAIGTSAPEIATSVVATLRGEREIAVGNAVGSNIFNLALVLGITAVVSPMAIPLDVATLGPDLLLMLGAAIACWPAFRSGMTFTRREASAFLLVYLGYLAWVVLAVLDAPMAPVAGVATLLVGIATLAWLARGALREPLGPRRRRPFRRPSRH